MFRGDARRLTPSESYLRSKGDKLLMTKFGLVDVLGSLDDLDFVDLLADTVEIVVEDMTVIVLSLRRLIEVKTMAGRPKELAVIPLLRATLARIEQSS